MTMRQCNNVTPKSPPKFLRNLGGLTGQAMQRGVSIYLAVVIMFVLLGIALGLSTILVGQIRTISGMGNSVTALYAADTGIERELYEENPLGTPPYSGYLDLNNSGGQDVEDSSYTVNILAPGTGSCPSSGVDRCIQSIGIYKGVRRAIEVTISAPPSPGIPIWRACEDLGVAPTLTCGTLLLSYMGYRFTPSINGNITELCGFFPDNIDKTVSLYEFVDPDYNLLISTTIASTNEWICNSIASTPVTAGLSYYVIAEILPAPYDYCRRENGVFLPTNCGTSVTIDYSVLQWSPVEPLPPFGTYSDEYNTMYGMVDIAFSP